MLLVVAPYITRQSFPLISSAVNTCFVPVMLTIEVSSDILRASLFSSFTSSSLNFPTITDVPSAFITNPIADGVIGGILIVIIELAGITAVISIPSVRSLAVFTLPSFAS